MKGDIYLGINRSKLSAICAYPSCKRILNLIRVPKNLRQQILKKVRFYVPERGLACEIHLNLETWVQLNRELVPELPFNVPQIIDMVDLLRFESKLSSTKNISTG